MSESLYCQFLVGFVCGSPLEATSMQNNFMKIFWTTGQLEMSILDSKQKNLNLHQS